MIAITCSTNCRQEARRDPDPAALLDRPAHDAAQDVAAVLVGRHDAVGDEERQRPRVVGEDPQRALVGVLLRELAAERHERHERVGLEDRVDALLDDRHPLEAEAGVDVARRQRGEALAAVLVRRQVVLREDEVPVLQEALVLAAGQVVGGAPLQAAIDVQLAARPARSARPGLPEVLRARAQHDPLTRDADRQPRLDRLLVGAEAELLVALEDRDPDVVGVEAEAGLRQVPGPLDGLLLEVVADREVAEHLEERQVARRVADVLDVGRAKALLDGRQPRMGRRLLAAEVRDERMHPRRRQQHRRVASPPARATPRAAAGGRAPRSRRGTSRGSRRSSCPWRQAIVAHPTIASPRRKTAVCPGAAPSNGSSRWM